MKYAIEVVPFGEYAHPKLIVELARAAEEAGWDALFLWDHLGFVWGMPSADPWVALAAVAQATENLRFGVDVTPLPRRRPHILATTLTGLDLLSNGRVIFCAGLGGLDGEFTAFGDEGQPRQRAERLDEGLMILDGLLSGAQVEHQGKYFTVKGITLNPLPVQKPRPPIWIGGDSPSALRRAARWDGWVIGGVNEAAEYVKSPEDITRQIAFIHSHRTRTGAFEVAFSGITAPGETGLVQDYAAAGVTWWLEVVFGLRGSHNQMLERIMAGPPAWSE
jgi:alkanesulfonate monooxygenase SsuD/methylene tetrahydromethanopterin reductase-like flavin-dependent oxidoreductase (luciferase family)